MNIAADIATSVERAHRYWGWYLAAGIALIVLGAIAIGSETLATLASVVALGSVLFVTGIVQLVTAFAARGAGHVILWLLTGILDAIIGVILIQHPGIGALSLTLIVAALLMFGGVYRFITALWLQFPNYGWIAASALLSFVLGILLWTEWPISALWFLGFAVGCSLIFNGFSCSALALKLKSL